MTALQHLGMTSFTFCLWQKNFDCQLSGRVQIRLIGNSARILYHIVTLDRDFIKMCNGSGYGYAAANKTNLRLVCCALGLCAEQLMDLTEDFPHLPSSNTFLSKQLYGSVHCLHSSPRAALIFGHWQTKSSPANGMQACLSLLL